MPKKRAAWIHVGAPGAGDILEPALVHHRRALRELGFASLAHTTDESFRAAVEVLDGEQEWGLDGLGGQLAGLVRRGTRAKAHLIFSQPMLAAATEPQIDRLADAFADHRVHVVVTAGGGDEGEVADRWLRAVRRPERLHVLEVDGAGPRCTWQAFGRVAGFGTASLPIDGVPPVVPRCDSLAHAQQELERLARRNAALETRVAELERKRRKLKRRLRAADATTG
ncbi:MAG TPA: hypothetical protein VN088_07495 [Nocardioides sp.]|nr:hypothetical protein [Nocardioides sp.]